MVIGLGLCPFAEPAFKADRIRYALFGGEETSDFLMELATELQLLVSTPRQKCETTLLIAPAMLPDFLDFNDFLGVVEKLVEELSLAGVIQVVGFHPGYRFADTEFDAPENYTNRSPYPVLHLLREQSVTEVADATDLLEIPRRNIRTLRKLGTPAILDLLKQISDSTRH